MRDRQKYYLYIKVDQVLFDSFFKPPTNLTSNIPIQKAKGITSPDNGMGQHKRCKKQ